MATIINNPGDGDSSSSAVGMIVGGIALLVVIGLFFVYVLPAMRNNEGAPAPQGTDLNVNVKLPADATPPTVPTPTPTPTPAQ